MNERTDRSTGAQVRERIDPAAARVPEAFVVWLWEHRHVAPTVATTDGVPVQIIYPGRRGGGWGPDFRGGLFAMAGQVVRGDVEVHVSARDWVRHGHQRDAAYQGTVLHVVLNVEPDIRCVRSDGSIVPTIAVADWVTASPAMLWRRWQNEPRCLPSIQPCRTVEEAGTLLDEAGMERFAARVDRYEADTEIVGSEQALWSGVCDALGYMENRAPFRSLADRLSAGEAQILAGRSDPDSLAAVLFGEAGLLPSQRGRLPFGAYAETIEAHWAASGRRGPAQPLGWRWIGVRPANQPVRRVAAAARILQTDGCGGTGRQLGERVLMVLSSEPAPRVPRMLARIVGRADEGYWREHQDFGVPLRRPAALVGEARDGGGTPSCSLPPRTPIAGIRSSPRTPSPATWSAGSSGPVGRPR
jgi:hypothetical protein